MYRDSSRYHACARVGEGQKQSFGSCIDDLNRDFGMSAITKQLASLGSYVVYVLL
jgi:hypothetical protein